MFDESVFGAMERLRLGAVAGLDRLDAMISDYRKQTDSESSTDEKDGEHD